MKIFLIAFLLLAAGWVQGQKYGHMNLVNLLEMLPETKRANQDLKIYSDMLSAKDSAMTKAFQAEYNAMEADYNAGKLPPVESQKRQEALQKQQKSIQQFEQDAQRNITSKREELLKPILTKINQAIKNVAKANGFVMIIDSSSGTLLFADDSTDIMALVKTELRLPN